MDSGAVGKPGDIPKRLRQAALVELSARTAMDLLEHKVVHYDGLARVTGIAQHKISLAASAFDETAWPEEEVEDGELAATFFRHITRSHLRQGTVQFHLEERSRRGFWRAQGVKLFYSSGPPW